MKYCLIVLILSCAFLLFLNLRRQDNSICEKCNHENLMLAEASQLALIYQLRREYSLINTASMFNVMSITQDKMVVALRKESGEFSSKGKEKALLLLATAAWSREFGYDVLQSASVQDQERHQKALSILTNVEKEYDLLKRLRRDKRHEGVKLLRNVKEPEFYDEKSKGGVVNP